MFFIDDLRHYHADESPMLADRIGDSPRPGQERARLVWRHASIKTLFAVTTAAFRSWYLFQYRNLIPADIYH